MKTPFELFAFEVGAGWLPHAQAAVTAIRGAGGSVLQVKEKFGGLRIYFEAPADVYDQLDRLVDDTAYRCSFLCEDCGKEAACVRTEGWLKTLCPACARSDEERDMLERMIRIRRAAIQEGNRE